MSRTSLAILVLAVGTGLATGQTSDEKYKAKLAKEFAKKITWELDFKKAQERAKNEKKLIMGYFTRSFAP